MIKVYHFFDNAEEDTKFRLLDCDLDIIEEGKRKDLAIYENCEVVNKEMDGEVVCLQIIQ